MGVAVDYSSQSLVEGCLKLLKNEAFYRRCRANALAFAAKLSWNRIFDQAFSDTAA